MRKRNLAIAGAVIGAVAVLSLPGLTTAAKSKPAADGRDKCYSCHDEVKALKEGSKHAKLSCRTCHDKLDAHMNDPEKNKPVTVIDQALCGKCHKSQYNSFFTVNYEAAARKEKGTPTGRSPMQDKLLAGHGFTFEHNEPRGHAFMVIDQFVVDRFQGGRFQFKDGWKGIDKTGRTWDVLTDTGKKLSETAMAGNPTCIQCKTSDHILKWKFMGDKDPKAQWDRSSDIVAVAKDTQNAVGCIHCHDPHGAQPRVVRDALIQAIDKDRAGNIFAKNGATDLKTISFRDGFRKIGVMQKTDSRMMCAQCHVEYNCNAGSQWSNGKPVKYDDGRTNHFPLKNSLQLLKHYKELDFFDFKHAVTGARLVKFQHPEAETYAGSVHDKAGIQCHQCHMPKQKGKDGKLFSNHGVVRPKNHVKESCLGCHPTSSAEQKLYQIDAVQNYVKGKMRKAEYWLGQLIDTYAAAQRMGVTESVLAQAREKHEEAHVLWEYWTAENSDGFHNPDLARESLTGSISASKAGVKILNDAMAVARKDDAKK
ncbi:ammonia-forming cytochrome c nitrite reductase subunit c552 [Geobacter sp. FeAm09]|uniref:ammonia-forming cytochrome c nitrite reductase subunit c552 n=1 Tax=Geobacter sp. FeAm09 TaxID=2597769 RepID=UPI0011EE555E|nr:ammonia-forming cytochrome c nitrite reductase subunit c552 [Geobacter sp. FeAm09]QEM67199.1 ammonia-forming cytochrome c nitrite reductase subunit c552 [Geobacter sp. FeAm09]